MVNKIYNISTISMLDRKSTIISCEISKKKKTLCIYIFIVLICQWCFTPLCFVHTIIQSPEWNGPIGVEHSPQVCKNSSWPPVSFNLHACRTSHKSRSSLPFIAMCLQYFPSLTTNNFQSTFISRYCLLKMVN